MSWEEFDMILFGNKVINGQGSFDEYILALLKFADEKATPGNIKCLKAELIDILPENRKDIQMSGEPILFYDFKAEYGELSNFYPLKPALVYKDKIYPTSEHLYQAMKFMYKGASAATLAYAEIIRLAKTPNIAKILASQKIAGGYAWRTALNPIIAKSKADGVVINSNWEEVKDDVMYKVIKLKFTANKHCRDVLLSTRHHPLAEHTTRDTYWADGGGNGKGKNMLGQLLVKLRRELKN